MKNVYEYRSSLMLHFVDLYGGTMSSFMNDVVIQWLNIIMGEGKQISDGYLVTFGIIKRDCFLELLLKLH